MEPDLRTSTPRRVEAYLDQILAPLARRLSPFHRDELRRELREHLWARVDAYRELGQSEENAVTEALRQFGGAKDFTRQWRREWMKTPPRVTLREVWEAMRPAFRLSLTALVFVPAWAALAGWIAFDSALGGPSLGAVFNVSLAGTVFVLPLLFGLKQGRRAPRYSALGMFGALSVEILGLSAASRLGGALLAAQNPLMQGLDALLLLAFFWLPISCTTAALSGWWTRRQKA